MSEKLSVQTFHFLFIFLSSASICFAKKPTTSPQAQQIANPSKAPSMQQAVEKLLESGNRKDLCSKSEIERQAMLYANNAFPELKKIRKCLSGQRGGLLSHTMTKNFTMTKNLNFFKPDCEDDNLEEPQELKYTQELAAGFARAMTEECRMCQDESRLKNRRSEVLSQLHYPAQAPCKPGPGESPEIIILSETHDVQEKGGLQTPKRALLENTLLPQSGITVVTEALSRDASPIAQARLLNYFKLPVKSSNLDGIGKYPVKTEPRIVGLDDDKLIAVRTLQLMILDVDSLYSGSTLQGGLKAKANRTAFFEFAVKNKVAREMLESLSADAQEPLAQEKLFGKKPRLPLDSELNQVWQQPSHGSLRRQMGEMANAFLHNASTAEIGINTVDKSPYWNADFNRISNQANPRHNSNQFDDNTFYSLLRTMLQMGMNKIPEINTPETAGGLLRDWAFTENVKAAVCEAIKNPQGPQKIVVSLGRAHATRVADLLKGDGFGSNIRHLNADAIEASSIVSLINSKTNHEAAITKAEGSYREACDAFKKPSRKIEGVTTPTLIIQKMGNR